MQTGISVPKSPFCARIRSKKFYDLEQMPIKTEHLLDQSGWCWCNQTMQTIGPDGELVQPEDCTAARVCYVSVFADSADA